MRPTNLKKEAAVLDLVASLAGRYRDPVLILSTHLEPSWQQKSPAVARPLANTLILY